ncbi:MAG: acyl-CoA dehydrogenase family protein [Candidatus Binataceae bacterium]
MPTHSIEAPEPALSPEAMIARAREMRPMLRERQLECERAGRILPATHKQFVEAGFYRIVQPRRFGGYEFDLPAFHRVMIEIARGCPSSGWVLALTAGHPLILARFDERAQLEAYGADGDFRAPASGAPVLIHPAIGGYTVKGFWDYASGCDVGTHFIGPAIFPRAPGEPLHQVLLLLSPQDYRIVDNWQVFAMQGTGSKRIAIENEIFVPDYRTAQGGLGQDPPAQSCRIEGLENPLYHGRITSFLIGEAAAVVVGTARGAIDIYEEILAIKPTSFPPFVLRSKNYEHQEYLGRAHALVETAEAALLKFSDDYTRLCAARMRDESAFGDEQERALILRLQQCVNLCWDAVDLLFATSGTSNARVDSMLGRYFRDLAVMRTHIVLQHARTAANFGQLRLGQPPLTPM